MAASGALLEVRVNELTASNEASQRALVELQRTHEAIVKAHAATVVTNGELQRTNDKLQRTNDELQRENADLVSEGGRQEREREAVARRVEEVARRVEEEDTRLEGGELEDLEETLEEILLHSPGSKEEEKQGTEEKDEEDEEEGAGSEHEDEKNKEWESELITSLSSELLPRFQNDDFDQAQGPDAKLVLVGTGGTAWDGSDVASAWQLVEGSVSVACQGVAFGVRVLAVGVTGFALVVLAGVVAAGSLLGAASQPGSL